MQEKAKSFLPKSGIIWSRSPVLLALILFAACFFLPEGCRVKSETTSKDSLEHLSLIGAKKVKMMVVYDNYLHDKRLQTDWGFGCVIYIDEDAILFDTGSDGNVLLSNMKKMGIDLREINMVILSHIHGDHVGGLHHFLIENSKVDVYVPASFPKSFNNGVKATGAKLHLVSGAARLAEHAFSTGELNNIEQSLVLVTEKGLVVVTGCAHPGIVRIVEKAKQMIESPVELVFGGFHLSGASRSKLQSIIQKFQQMGVTRVGPCHCSGDQTRRMFQQAYGEDYIDVGVGRIISF